MFSNKRIVMILSLFSISLSSAGWAQDPRSTAGAVINVVRVGSGSSRMCGPDPAREMIEGQQETFSTTLANIGAKLWELVVNNQRPIGMDFTRVKAHALPIGVTEPMQLEGWCGTASSGFELDYRNIIGMTLFKSRIQVSFLYGAAGANGGKHIANIMVVPAELESKIGFTANAKVQISDPVYLSGKVASMIVAVEVNVRGPIDDATVTQVWEIRGDGKILSLGGRHERIAENSLKILQETYLHASNAAQNVEDKYRSIAVSCVDQVFADAENSYVRGVLSRTNLTVGQMQYALEEYGKFMAERARDAELHEATRPGVNDLIGLHIRQARHRSEWPAPVVISDVQVLPAQAAQFTESAKLCLREEFLESLHVNLPTAVLTDEYLEGKVHYHRVTFKNDGTGIVAVWESQDQPF